jgi:hypothetical protein
MYRDDSITFSSHTFMEFWQLCEWHHEQIWNVDINKIEEILAFAVRDKEILARHKGNGETKKK